MIAVSLCVKTDIISLVVRYDGFELYFFRMYLLKMVVKVLTQNGGEI